MGKNSSTFAPSLLARRRNAVFPPPYPLIDTTSELENRKYIANNVLIASFNLRSSFETRFEILSYLYFDLLLLRKSFIFERKKKKSKRKRLDSPFDASVSSKAAMKSFERSDICIFRCHDFFRKSETTGWQVVKFVYRTVVF